MAPRGRGGRGARGHRAGGRQRVPVSIALLLPVLAAAAGLSLQPGRMRHLGVCPNQLNPNLWVDAQSTCERECQHDQVSEGATEAASGNRVWGASPGPQRRCFGVRVLCRAAQPVHLFPCNGLSPAAAFAPKPLLSAGLPSPPQAEKMLVAPSRHPLRPCPMVRPPSSCTPRMLPRCQRAAWDEGNGCAGTRSPSSRGQNPVPAFP